MKKGKGKDKPRMCKHCGGKINAKGVCSKCGKGGY